MTIKHPSDTCTHDHINIHSCTMGLTLLFPNVHEQCKYITFSVYLNHFLIRISSSATSILTSKLSIRKCDLYTWSHTIYKRSTN